MIELHYHLLSGLGDGAPNLPASSAIARAAIPRDWPPPKEADLQQSKLFTRRILALGCTQFAVWILYLGWLGSWVRRLGNARGRPGRRPLL